MNYKFGIYIYLWVHYFNAIVYGIFSTIAEAVCTANLLQKVCGKFEFLSNNCSPKKTNFSTGIEQTIKKKIECASKQFVKHLTARIKNFV
jgi:hypothetical protein